MQHYNKAQFNNIWKFKIDLNEVRDDGSVYLTLPENASVLTVQHQEESGLCLWALVDDSTQNTERRRFFIYLTGISFHMGNKNLKYINTCQLSNGTLVLHIFEEL
jgi:hypothetical protein